MEENYPLARWLAGEMQENELAVLKSSAEFKDYEKIVALSGTFSAPAFDGDAVYNNVIASKKSKVIPLYQSTWFRVAAVIVILMGLAVLIRSFLPSTENASNGQQIAFTLPDTSEVILNAGSEITYSKWNWKEDRKIDLEGEAYFKVAKGKTFEVSTDIGQIAVLGTQFNVKSRNGRLDVVCYEGRVKVKYNQTEVIIDKGDHVAFADGKQIEVPSSDATRPSWMDNELQFSKENLAGIIDELTRQYNIKIELKSKAPEQLFTGTLPMNNITEALEIICATFHLEANKSNNVILLEPMNGGD